MDQSHTIARVCGALTARGPTAAASILEDRYPFDPVVPAQRRITPYQSTRLFIRDGFIDRYSGARLVFPGTLKVLSERLPHAFPAHAHWKMAETHSAYWELYPTVDHVLPVARGGRDVDENRVTTSMIRNNAKSNWTLKELGWDLVPTGEGPRWDGLLPWFLDFVEVHNFLLGNAYIKRWYGAANRARGLL